MRRNEAWRFMKKLMTIGAMMFALAVAAAPVTLESPLQEMIDPDANTYFPQPPTALPVTSVKIKAARSLTEH